LAESAICAIVNGTINKLIASIDMIIVFKVIPFTRMSEDMEK
jgi:hypothetical protein